MTSPLDETLETLRAAFWRDLSDAIDDRDSPFRTPVLATVEANGAPSARIVVLRAVAAETAELGFHSDHRAAKVRALSDTPRAAVTFWHPSLRVQYRVEGAARIETSGARVDAAWDATPEPSRWSYGGAPAPGVEIATPDVFAHAHTDAEARRAFAIVTLQVTSLDRLELSTPRHRRAVFTWDGSGQPNRAAWRAP